MEQVFKSLQLYVANAENTKSISHLCISTAANPELEIKQNNKIRIKIYLLMASTYREGKQYWISS